MGNTKASLAFVFFVFFCCTCGVEPFNLYILHTNDIHARYDMFSAKESVCKLESDQKSEKTKCYGGVVRRAGFVNDFRKKHENVLLLDAGDQFQGTPWFYTYKGVEASHFLNLLKYDAMALGNHEFDNGVDGLIPFLKNVTVPILCSNLVMNENVPEAIKKSVKGHVVLERGGRKIGVIGYITDEVPNLSNAGSLSFDAETSSIRPIAEKLTAEGVDIIVALGHSGLKKDQEMAAELENVDVIVGGHSHSLFYTGPNPHNDEVSAEYPVVFKHSDAVTLVVQAGSLGKYVGVLNLTFDDRGKLTRWSGNPVVIDENVPEDGLAKAEMQLLNGKVSSVYNDTVGSSLVDLDASENRCRIRECNIGNLFADAVVDAVREIENWKNATLAITPGGSLRGSLAEGNITFGDLMTVLPFGNKFQVVIVNGSTLTEVLEHSVAGFELMGRKGKYLQMSGMRVTYDFTKNDGSRVKRLEIERCYRCKEYDDVELEKNYLLLVDSYILGGGDGYLMLKQFKEKSFNTGWFFHPILQDLMDTDIFVKYLKKYSPVNARVEGRIKGMESFPGWTETAASGAKRASFEPAMSILSSLLIVFYRTKLEKID